jgi:hypothetical protein
MPAVPQKPLHKQPHKWELCRPLNFMLMAFELHPHNSAPDLHLAMAEAPQVELEPCVQDSVLEVENAAGGRHIQKDNHTSPNNIPLEQLELFEHDPLEYHGSTIRLVKVRLSKNANDPVQCDIRFASTDNDYFCLSYVWGNREPGDWILMNDKRFWARQSLFDFLTSARSLVDIQPHWIWIDALCIDQENIEEREHQVKRMGHIYSCANRVVSWLGSDYRIALFLRFMQAGNYDYAAGRHSFCTSPYWERAWITQEMALARRISFMACKMILDADRLSTLPSSSVLEWWSELMESFTYLRTISRETSLFQLLGRSLDKKCQYPRDRIFSLLALCWDGVNVSVDYTISDVLLAWTVLNSCNHGFCLCSIRFVHRGLKLNALSSPCPRGFTPAGEYRCAGLTLPVLWCEDVLIHTVMDENKQEIQEDDEAWKLSNISWGGTQTLRDGWQPVSHLSRCVVKQGEFWLENHLVGWRFENKLRKESWLIVCISLTLLCDSHTGWLNLIVNVNTSCAHYHIARDQYDHNTPPTGIPYLEAKWWPKPGGHVFPVRLSPDARVCRVVLPINFWHVVSEKHRQRWKNVKETPLESCTRAGASEDEARLTAGKAGLELCPEGSTPGIYEV